MQTLIPLRPGHRYYFNLKHGETPQSTVNVQNNGLYSIQRGRRIMTRSGRMKWTIPSVMRVWWSRGLLFPPPSPPRCPQPSEPWLPMPSFCLIKWRDSLPLSVQRLHFYQSSLFIFFSPACSCQPAPPSTHLPLSALTPPFPHTSTQACESCRQWRQQRGGGGE